MGLYDGYKQNNSTYIPQFVGSVVPELKDFSTIMQNRYNQARDTDDALVEAMGNLQHLDSEEDTTYANELKQSYMTRLMERSEREDYENLGRRTKRDAQQFSSEYVPLVNRMKGMQSIQERVLQDKDVHSPETKQRILGRIKHMNGTERNPETGDFVRDASGKIKLSAIQDWAYAKDVDINKKLADFLKAKETDISQSGYASDGRGLMTSVKRETRSLADIARLAKEMMETDPEIKAMVERDVELATYNYTPGELSQMANRNNVSIYDRLVKNGLSPQQIKSNLAANGVSMEEAKLKPVDTLRQNYAAKGRSPQDADRDFIRHQVRKGITDPHVDLVANLLKVDRQTLEAREDPEFAARKLAQALSALMPENSGDASPLIVTPDDAVQEIDIVSTHNKVVEASEKLSDAQSNLKATISSYLGMPKPNGKSTTAWDAQTGRYLNDKAAQGQLIQKLLKEGKQAEANNLTQAFRQYDNLSNQVIYAKQTTDNIVGQIDFKSLYQDYLKTNTKPQTNQATLLTGIGGAAVMAIQAIDKMVTTKTKPLSFEQFKNTMINSPKINHRTLFGSGDYIPEKDTFVNRITGNTDPMEIRIARDKYFKTLQAKATEYGKSLHRSNTTIEPIGPGWVKNQTEYIENGLRTFSIKGKDMATGKDFKDIIREELGTSGLFRMGDNDLQIEEEDRSNPNSDYNKAMRQLKVRVNADIRGANGEPTVTVTTPNGQIRTIVLDNISPNLPTEMAARTIGAAGKYMTRGESTHLMQSAAKGAFATQLKNIGQVDLYNIRPAAKPYQINDMYGLKVTKAGVDGVGNPTNVYSLLVKKGDKYVPTKISNRTDINDIAIAVGGDYLKSEMSTIPSVDLLER